MQGIMFLKTLKAVVFYINLNLSLKRVHSLITKGICFCDCPICDQFPLPDNLASKVGYYCGSVLI